MQLCVTFSPGFLRPCDSHILLSWETRLPTRDDSDTWLLRVRDSYNRFMSKLWDSELSHCFCFTMLLFLFFEMKILHVCDSNTLFF